ncbi:MAG TPA: MmgE/PrpD family protein [Acetobacteraceae bacterium]|nr:MmgE/PrpD family protein [Acetobacteraceae bacterium]
MRENEAAGNEETGAMGITREFSEFAAGLTLGRLPAEVVERARFLVLDLIGNIIRARAEAESTPALLAGVRALGLGVGNAGVFGDAARYAPAGAALINGALGHSLDFDDTHAEGCLHPGVTAIAAALAAGEMVGSPGADVLAGIIAGYEVSCRLALALPAGEHYARGFHPSATCGAFGAAAAAARTFRLPAEAMESTFGIALSQTSGSLEFLVNGAWTKRFQVGWAAMNGLAAACFARAGFKGAAGAFEGPHGFLRAYAPSPAPARATERLGEVFELMATAVKPYPSCRFGHAGIDAALALREQHSLRPEEIEAVTLGLSRAGMRLIGAPAEKKSDPRNVVDGQFSGPFVLAVALTTGRMDWDSYRLLDDPALRRLLPRITCVHDDAIEAEFPTNMAGKVTIRARGQVFEKTVRVPKGEPGNFLSEAELRGKFASLATPVLGAGPTAALADAALRIATLANIAVLLRQSAPEETVRLAGE